MLNLLKTIVYNIKTIIWPLIAFMLYALGRTLENHSKVVELLYSTRLNKWAIQVISKLTGLVPFSIGEILFIIHVLAIPVLVIIMVRAFRNGQFLLFSKKLISYVSIVYILFMLLWGFNYSRESFAEVAELEVKDSSTEELYEVTEALIIKANKLRENVEEDSDGVMMINGGFQSVFDRSEQGYQEIASNYSELDGSYGKPKPILLSKPMLHTRIVGVYMPFTGEPNINTATPDLSIPTNTLHEMAHQRGFAYEDEANYLAYLTATAHPDVDFQYSGTVFALRYSISALYRDDSEKATTLMKKYSEGLKRDIVHINGFWSRYDGKTSDVANKVNDSYLKGNGQEEGTKSYGQMVDLLLAHYRTYGEI